MKKSLYAFLISCCSLTASAQWTPICTTGNGFVVTLDTFKGNVYSTGFFTEDCGGPANYINKWDGTTWSAVDTGLTDPGHRIEVINDSMYVAKYQLAIDSNWLYKWDGSHFVKFGPSVYLTTAVAGFSKTPSIYDVVQYNGDLVISGEFDLADGKHISGVARWTGTTWDSLGSGLSGSITASNVMYPHQMLAYNDTLYVIGNFTTAGGVTVNGVAKWDGANWHAMGAGFNAEVYAIAVYNGVLYAGGGFTKTGTTTMHHIAKWDGSSWVDPGFGVYTDLSASDPNAYVHTIKQIGTRLFVTGGFTHMVTTGVDTVACNNIIEWDGINANTLGGGTVNRQIEGIIPYGTNSILVSGGYNNDSSYVAEYNLTSLGTVNVAKPVQALTVYPVPAGNTLQIDGVTNGSRIQILDMPGKTVYTTVAVGNPAQADISGLPMGTYLLRVTDPQNGIRTRVIVKQ